MIKIRKIQLIVDTVGERETGDFALAESYADCRGRRKEEGGGFWRELSRESVIIWASFVCLFSIEPN